MRLEGEMEPTGFYNYLPRPGRKTRKARKTEWQKRTGMQGIGPLKKGPLKAVGYEVTDPKTRRHAAVDRAIKKYGKLSTLRKLNAVAVYTRRSSPGKSRTFKSDVRYVQRKKSS
jgi:hypothetical protein